MFLTDDDKVRQYLNTGILPFFFLSANAMATSSAHTVYHVSHNRILVEHSIPEEVFKEPD
jgi:hypothetical protein